MIPEFPNFKKLELTDKEEVEKITSKFPPYSDFNFVSMWSWDIKGEMRISKLNNNLVVKFTDYLIGSPFFSFLGENKLLETAQNIIDFAKKTKASSVPCLVPEEIAKNLSNSGFCIKEDRDNFDYIYSVSSLSKMDHWTQNSSGKYIRSFIKKCPDYVVKHSCIKECGRDEFMEMFKKWAKNKDIENYLEFNEYKALERVFKIKDKNVNTISIYIHNLLVGFTIYEILPSNYAISHFAKADTEYSNAINDLLNWEEAKILDLHGVKYLNWAEDLGIPGLRKLKEKYKPSFLFKKLIISRKD